MEKVGSNSETKVRKVKALNGNASPLKTERDDQNHNLLIGKERYLQSITVSTNSPLVRYFRAGSLLSGAGEPFTSPIVQEYSGNSGFGCGSGGRRLWLSPLASVENLEKVYEEEVIVMDEDAIQLRSTSGKSKMVLKTEICRAWEESGNCRYGSKCPAWFPSRQNYTNPTLKSTCLE